MRKYSNEFKVGIFVLLCIGGLFYLTYRTGKLNIKKGGYRIYVVFDEIAGLEKKAPVALNGVKVGKVEDIKISYGNNTTRSILTLWLDEQAKIRDDAVVSVRTLGLMGEKYIQITSSSGKDFIKPESILEGRPYLDMDTLIEQTQSISKDISQQVNKLVTNLNFAVEDNRGNIAEIIKNLESASKNFEEFSADVKQHPWKLLMKEKEKQQKLK